jgi:Fe2+ transport system protein B
MVVKGMKEFLKNNTIIICATVIILWAMSAVTVLVVTGNTMGLRTIVGVLGPVIVNLATLIGINVRVKEAKGEVRAVHEVITNGDATDAAP